MVRSIEHQLGVKLERRKLEGFDYSAQPAPAAHGAPHARHHAHAPRHHVSGAARPAPGAPAHRQPQAPGSGHKPAGGFHGHFGRSRFRRRR